MQSLLALHVYRAPTAHRGRYLLFIDDASLSSPSTEQGIAVTAFLDPGLFERLHVPLARSAAQMRQVPTARAIAE